MRIFKKYIVQILQNVYFIALLHIWTAGSCLAVKLFPTFTLHTSSLLTPPKSRISKSHSLPLLYDWILVRFHVKYNLMKGNQCHHIRVSPCYGRARVNAYWMVASRWPAKLYYVIQGMDFVIIKCTSKPLHCCMRCGWAEVSGFLAFTVLFDFQSFLLSVFLVASALSVLA